MTKHKLDHKHIFEALKSVRSPNNDSDIVKAGMISGLQISELGEVVFMIEVDARQGHALEDLRQQAEDAVSNLEHVQKVTAVLTAEKTADQSSPANDVPTAAAIDPHGLAKNPPLSLSVKKIIAVASGKGGVGKSTVAANLAISLAENSQLKVGLLDADIYGPSQPKMFGLEGCKPEFNAEKKIIPPRKNIGTYGLKVMSIGFMVDAAKALVWRGPMVQSAIYQLFRDVEWGSADGPLDVLIVDMPPGTGDAQLTLAQKVPVDGVIIVSTPQAIALADVRKGVEMFQTLKVPILGIIENMSTHICSNCGHEEPVFGHGGARDEAKKLGVPFLGEIPLSAHIRIQSDAGEPFGMNEKLVLAVQKFI